MRLCLLAFGVLLFGLGCGRTVEITGLPQEDVAYIIDEFCLFAIESAGTEQDGEALYEAAAICQSYDIHQLRFAGQEVIRDLAQDDGELFVRLSMESWQDFMVHLAKVGVVDPSVDSSWIWGDKESE